MFPSKILRFAGVLAMAVAPAAAQFPPFCPYSGGIFHLRGESAQASFSDTSGCITTSVYVGATTGRVQTPPGPGQTQEAAMISINRWNQCTFTTLLSGGASVPLADQEFQVSGRLEGASLTKTIPVFDWVSQSMLNVAVDLSWSGTGELTQTSTQFHWQSPTCSVNSRTSGLSRPAAASGSVLVGGSNFTPQPAQFAQIAEARSGTVTID